MPVRHVVVQGECMASLADRYGFGDWRTIWDFHDNTEIKRNRSKPGILFPGDVVMIPDRAQKKEVGYATGQRHRFKVTRPQTTVHIAFKIQGAWKYELIVGDERFSNSVPDGSPIEHPIPPSAAEATLHLWPDKGDDEARKGLLTYSIALGHLDPMDEVSGVQGVLTNLGHYWGPIDGTLSETTRMAIQAFQREHGLDPSGEIDGALKNKLKEQHDG